MLEVRRIVDAGSEHHDGGVIAAGRRGGPQRIQQLDGIVSDRPHPMGRERLREHLRHGVPVLQGVAHPRGNTDVVLQHPEPAFFVTDQIDAGNVHPHPMWRGEPGRRTL